MSKLGKTFRLRFTEVEAMRVPMGPLNGTDKRAMEWAAITVWLGAGKRWKIDDGLGITIHAVTGARRALPGDWIVKVDGEYIPFSAAAFPVFFS